MSSDKSMAEDGRTDAATLTKQTQDVIAKEAVHCREQMKAAETQVNYWETEYNILMNFLQNDVTEPQMDEGYLGDEDVPVKGPLPRDAYRPTDLRR
jgi:hypothetical protein